MSVLKTKQNHTDLEALTKALELLDYTIQLCSNNNVFPIRKRWALPNDLYKYMSAVCMNLSDANDITVKDFNTAKARLDLDFAAYNAFAKYIKCANICCQIYNVGKKVDYWDEIVEEELKILKGFIKSEKDRYCPILEKGVS